MWGRSISDDGNRSQSGRGGQRKGTLRCRSGGGGITVDSGFSVESYWVPADVRVGARIYTQRQCTPGRPATEPGAQHPGAASASEYSFQDRNGPGSTGCRASVYLVRGAQGCAKG